MTSRFDELLEREFKWPKPGDKIFVDAEARGVQIDEDAASRRHHMFDGYKMAAKILTDAAVEGFSRKLIYPLMFCYRHALELTLKRLLERHGAAAGETPNRTDHDLLEKLWPPVRRVLEYYGIPPDDLEAVDAVEACIAELSKIDAGSFTFRYPTDKKGQIIPISYWPRLDQVRDTLGSIFDFFECVELELYARHKLEQHDLARYYCYS